MRESGSLSRDRQGDDTEVGSLAVLAAEREVTTGPETLLASAKRLGTDGRGADDGQVPPVSRRCAAAHESLRAVAHQRRHPLSVWQRPPGDRPARRSAEEA